MQKPTHEELAAAHTRQDWTLLWETAVPIVESTVRWMFRVGQLFGVDYDDMIQEGNLEAGGAIRVWNPLEYPFRTWIAVNLKRRLRKVVGKESAKSAVLADVDVNSIPVETDDSAAFVAAQVEPLLARLDPVERAVISYFYGIGVPEALSPEAIAHLHDVALRTVWRTIDRAHEKMRAA